jgi:hypothetical protein
MQFAPSQPYNVEFQWFNAQLSSASSFSITFDLKKIRHMLSFCNINSLRDESVLGTPPTPLNFIAGIFHELHAKF